MSAFVDTKALRAALSGREGDLLDALGIDWRSGRPHIQCPFPDHDDADPSWRWDQNKARAFCTCSEKGADALEILMRVRGIEFAEAKIEAARLLGREDIVRERGSKMDASALLSPPADQVLVRNHFRAVFAEGANGGLRLCSFALYQGAGG